MEITRALPPAFLTAPAAAAPRSTSAPDAVELSAGARLPAGSRLAVALSHLDAIGVHLVGRCDAVELHHGGQKIVVPDAERLIAHTFFTFKGPVELYDTPPPPRLPTDEELCGLDLDPAMHAAMKQIPIQTVSDRTVAVHMRTLRELGYHYWTQDGAPLSTEEAFLHNQARSLAPIEVRHADCLDEPMSAACIEDLPTVFRRLIWPRFEDDGEEEKAARVFLKLAGPLPGLTAEESETALLTLTEHEAERGMLRVPLSGAVEDYTLLLDACARHPQLLQLQDALLRFTGRSGCESARAVLDELPAYRNMDDLCHLLKVGGDLGSGRLGLKAWNVLRDAPADFDALRGLVRGIVKQSDEPGVSVRWLQLLSNRPPHQSLEDAASDLLEVHRIVGAKHGLQAAEETWGFLTEAMRDDRLHGRRLALCLFELRRHAAFDTDLAAARQSLTLAAPQIPRIDFDDTIEHHEEMILINGVPIPTRR